MDYETLCYHNAMRIELLFGGAFSIAYSGYLATYCHDHGMYFHRRVVE